MRQFYAILIFLGITLACVGCSRDDAAGGQVYRLPITIVATVDNFYDHDVSDDPITRAPVEDGLITRFNTGDAIGIFAIKEGAIVEAVNNTKLVYSKTGETGSWSVSAGFSPLYWYDGVTYIAYYPYKVGITIDASLSTDKIIESLTTNPALQPVSDQSDKEKYTASDLMTAVGTVTADAGTSGKVLSLKFTHRFTLLVLNPQIHVDCYEPQNAGFVYRIKSTAPVLDPKAKDVVMNGVTACRMDDGSYRAIVLPSTAGTIAGSYATIDGSSADQGFKTITYSGTETVFSAGKYYSLTVVSPLPGEGSVERKLAPGDFVFFGDSGIEIYPGDRFLTDGKIPDYDKAIGMVVTCDPDRMTDEKCNENGWTHAYVFGLNNLKNGHWSVNSVEEPIPNTPATSAADNMNGFTETEIMLEAHKDDLSNYNAFSQINDYRVTNKAPDVVKCSPWFLPSVGQWYDLVKNICGLSLGISGASMENYTQGVETLNKLNAQLGKVGKPLDNYAGYRYIFWCSSQFDAEDSWIMIWHMDDPLYPTWKRLGLKGYDKSAAGGYYVRPFFAF